MELYEYLVSRKGTARAHIPFPPYLLLIDDEDKVRKNRRRREICCAKRARIIIFGEIGERSGNGQCCFSVPSAHCPAGRDTFVRRGGLRDRFLLLDRGRAPDIPPSALSSPFAVRTSRIKLQFLRHYSRGPTVALCADTFLDGRSPIADSFACGKKPLKKNTTCLARRFRVKESGNGFDGKWGGRFCRALQEQPEERKE